MKSLRPVTLSQVISCEFCEIAKNIFLTEHVLATASINITILVKIILLSSTCSVRFTCQVFSCEFCDVSKNTYSYGTPPVVPSECSRNVEFEKRTLSHKISITERNITFRRKRHC